MTKGLFRASRRSAGEMRTVRRARVWFSAVAALALGSLLVALPAQASKRSATCAQTAAPNVVQTLCASFSLAVNYADVAQFPAPTGYPPIAVHSVIDAATQPREPLCHQASLVPLTTKNGLNGGFCFSATGTPNDETTCASAPQGITTTQDASSTTGATTYDGIALTVESWYDNNKCPDKSGVAPITVANHITMVVDDPNYARKVYAKILLVQPYNGPNGWTFKNVTTHAGGVVWHGDYLYVADTSYGMRIFNMAGIRKAVNGGSLGTKNGSSYDAPGYDYILPQVGEAKDTQETTDLQPVDNSPTAAKRGFAWSTLSFDEAENAIVAAEYTGDSCKTVSTKPVPAANEPDGTCSVKTEWMDSRAIRFPFPSATATKFGATVVDNDALVLPWWGINGVATHAGRWWFASSGSDSTAQQNSNHFLHYWTPSVAQKSYPWSTTAESMSYWADAANPDSIWAVRESSASRNVYNFLQADYDS